MMTKSGGFTLIEALAVVGLSALLILALAGSLNYSLALNTYSKSRLIAMNDARRVAEEVRTIADSAGLSGTGSVTDSSIVWNNFLSGILPNESAQVVTSGSNPINATITVSWKEKNRNESLQFTTKVTKR